MLIEADFSTIRDEFSLSEKQIDQLLDFTVKEVTAKFASLWEQEAANTLYSSRNLYMRSIIVTDPGMFMGGVELVNDLPNMIESGANAFDMKPNFLNGPNAKTGEDGKKYNTIPYSVGVPTSLPENFSTIMPQEVYDVILEKPQEIPIAGGVRSEGLTRDELPEQYREPIEKEVYNPNSERFEKYKHKSSIYEGMARQKSMVTQQNSYVSFRRVSENSDDLAWLHPGLFPRDLAEKALAKLDVPSEVGNAIDNFLLRL